MNRMRQTQGTQQVAKRPDGQTETEIQTGRERERERKANIKTT